MLIDFTEGAIVALPQHEPRSLVIRIADHTDYDGFIAVGYGRTGETLAVQPVRDESFEPFRVHELVVGRKHLTGTITTFWVHSAQTDGTDITRSSFTITLQHEGGNGWWVEVQQDTTEWGQQAHFGFLGAVFRLPLPDFDPDFGRVPEVVEREADWAKLASDDS